MKMLASVLALATLPALAGAEDTLRWTDGKGTIHYTNQRELAPAEASEVETRLIMEVSRIPRDADLLMEDGVVREVAEPAPPREQRPAPYRIYNEERRRFGCFASDVLYAGGWSHPDDITVQGNCLPYMLGPEAWLNAARAELALREHGIDPREVAAMYESAREPVVPRVTSVNLRD
jgi:hypothetical protein